MRKSPYPPLYFVWKSMISRCHCSSNTSFHKYGGRGIKVCKRWRESYDAFFKDMGMRPTPKHQLDRVNNNGNYSKKNCRWVTRSENLRNTRRNNLVTFKGVTRPITDWAKEIGIEPNTLKQRLKNWPLKKAMTEKPHLVSRQNGRKRQMITFRGKTQSKTKWAQEVGVSIQALNLRIKNHGITKALTTPKSFKNDRFHKP